MLGTSGYVRNKLDFYPTPKSAVDSALQVLGDEIPTYRIWEPFCGDGAITKILAPDALDIVSTDIIAYEGFDADALIDFFSIKTQAEVDALAASGLGSDYPTLRGISALKGFEPDVIFSNPPYGELAARAARRALEIMEEVNGAVILLCRHDWDTAKSRADLFDHPAFARKIVMRHRPRWIPGSKIAPRFSYAWYVWDWVKANTYAGGKAELHYAA